jgi:hypothetical protein
MLNKIKDYIIVNRHIIIGLVWCIMLITIFTFGGAKIFWGFILGIITMTLALFTQKKTINLLYKLYNIGER